MPNGSLGPRRNRVSLSCGPEREFGTEKEGREASLRRTPKRVSESAVRTGSPLVNYCDVEFEKIPVMRSKKFKTHEMNHRFD